MAYVFPSEGSLDYYPCQYGSARVFFRGPRRDIEGGYVAVLGGTESYGKFVPAPFSDVLEHRIGLPVANLACVNAGLDLYLNDPALAQVAQGACVCVVQIIGAHNLSNRYYKVHPRRNDRFLGATPALRAIFPRVDFTEFNFTRHMLMALQDASPDRFEVIAEELRSAWVARMQLLLSRLRRPAILTWFASAKPPSPEHRVDLHRSPILVDSEMIAAVRSLAVKYIEVIYEKASKPAEGMVFAPMETLAAVGLPGPAAHKQMAAQLQQNLRGLI